MKIYSKALCLLLSISMVLPVTSVPAFSSGNTPVTDEVIYNADFSDSVLDDRIVKRGGNGILEEADNKLILTRTSTSIAGANSSDGYEIYFNEDKETACSEYFTALSFSISRSAAKLISLNVVNEQEQNVATLDFAENGSINASYKNDEDEAVKETVAINDCTNKDIKITYAFNMIDNRASLWVDSELVLENVGFSNQASGLMKLAVKMMRRNAASVYMGDLKLFTYAVTDAESVMYEKKLLSFSDISSEQSNAITGNLNFFEKGRLGCNIEWDTSDYDIIGLDGTVNRTVGKDENVKVTAYVKKGDVTEKVEFDVTVKQIVVTEMPDIKALLSENTDEIDVSAGEKHTHYISESTGGILAVKFTVESEGEYKFEVAGERGAALEVVSDHETLKVKESNGEYTTVKLGVPALSEYTVLIDAVTKRYSLWLGIDKLVTMKQVSDVNVPAVDVVNIEQLTESGRISDFSAFYPKVPSDDAFVLDTEYLTFDKLTYQEQDEVTNDLTLEKQGRAGSTIEWISSDETVISTDGRVNAAENAEVNLTAVITNGENTVSKDFSITVIKWEKDEVPEVKRMLIDEKFDDNNPVSNWDFKTTGGDVLVEGESIVVKRNVNEDMTIADMYMDDESNIYRGFYVLEFTLSRSAAKDVVVRQRGTGDFCAFTWQPNGRLMYYNGATNAWEYTPVLTNSNNVKFTLLINTPRETYSVLMNDKLAIKDVKSRNSNMGISYMRIYLEKSNYHDVVIDNVRFFEAELLSEDRVLYDFNELTERTLVSDDDFAYSYDMISKDLLLYTKGSYGSDISWTTSDETLISEDGKVTHAFGENDTVKLTATITSGKFAKEKEFTFKVVKGMSDEEAELRADTEFLDYDVIAPYDGGSNKIKRSLYLTESTIYGSKVSWKSSNKKYITDSGRVTRPRHNENDVEVTMTATVTKGNHTLTKDLVFTVLKDDEWTDPQFLPDEEFFGVWNGSEWTTESKFNYSYPGLEKVCEAAKTGDYALAKEELLRYYAQRPPKSFSIALSQRNSLWAQALTDGYYHLKDADYFQGEFTVKNEWTQCESDLRTDNVVIGGISGFSVRAWYNESSYAEIKRHDDENINHRPRIELTVNGEIRTYYAVDSIVTRAGDFKNINYSDSDVLKVQTFGDFLGNDTSYAAFNFNFSDLTTEDKITSAKLIVYAKASPAFSGLKRMIVIKEGITWDSKTSDWNDFTGTVYSFNGLPDGNDWNTKPEGSDVEYWYQMARLAGYSSAIPVEYLVTGDDSYIYKMLNNLYDLMRDTGGQKRDAVWPNVHVHVPDGLRGGWPRSLDSAIRNMYMLRVIELIAKSEVITPEMFTILIKGIWDVGNFLSTYQSDGGNWRQTEFNNLILIGSRMPEFYESNAGKNWLKMGQDELESVLFVNNMNDGSYIEDTGHYNIDMFSQNANFKRDMKSQGTPVSDRYDKLLHKMAYYNGLMYTPDGRELQYGDGPSGIRDSSRFLNVAEWYEDEELEYIMTFGQKGVEPEWTSRYWPLSMVTAMRANWSVNSPYLFTSVRGDADHGHNDDNAVIVAAYGRTLLNDAGIFTYTGSDPMRLWGRSTVAHNSVVINDGSQTGSGWGLTTNAPTTGKLYDWTTNRAFDYLSQSTPLNKHNGGFEHRRSITFIKPCMWIISDLMIPNNADNNNYKQVWHMVSESNFTLNKETNVMRSNYPTGANIIVANADGDEANLKKEQGWYDLGYQQTQDAPYAYFEKSGIGNVTLDTVLMVSNDDLTAQAKAQKLETGANAVALKIDYTLENSNNTGYYYMSYNKKPGRFGKYSTDGQIAFVREDSTGKAEYFMIYNGSYIKDETTGKYLLNSGVQLEELAVDMSNPNITITSAASDDLIMANPENDDNGIAVSRGFDTDLSKTSINIGSQKLVAKVTVNKEQIKYNVNDGILTLSSEKNENSENVNVPSGGIIKDNNGSGSSSGGSSSGGGSATPSPGVTVDSGFSDVTGHWCQLYANSLKQKGILNGDSEGRFNPENNVTRAEFTAMIVRAMGYDSVDYMGEFEDVSQNDWYADVIQTAINKGIVSKDTHFRPNDNITRQEMAKIISIAAGLSGRYNEIEIATPIFDDSANIDGWAKEYVDFVCSAGIMNGMDDLKFYPRNNATRAQAAAVISRLISN